MKNTEYTQGFYNPINKHKYKGKKNPFYRSSWEKRIFFWCDTSEYVLEWNNESLIIPYLFELDNKTHRYYPDIIATINTKTGIKKFIIEIKPYKQTIEPEKPKNNNIKRQQRYTYEMVTWIRNNNKWRATKEYCNKNNYEFKIITENELWNGKE